MKVIPNEEQTGSCTAGSCGRAGRVLPVFTAGSAQERPSVAQQDQALGQLMCAPDLTVCI